jgi:hypothetical protein
MNRPWPAVTTHLKEKYNIIAEIDLSELDSDPQLLYRALKLAYKKYYEPNDRILIYHYDTDFYRAGGPGFTISNLMSCLDSLDISINFCLLLTNHYGISNEIAQLSYNEFGMSIFENNYQLLQTNPDPCPIDINVDKIVKPYVCLNGAKRSHRVMFLCYIREHQLLDCGILSWHFDSASPELPNATNINSNTINLPTAPVFVTTTPFTRVNDLFYIDPTGRKIFNQHYKFFQSNWKDSAITGGPNQNRWDIPAIQQAFLYVSVETVLQYPYPYLTEKTFRAILHKRPFVILGAQGSLAQIKKLGFKTFDHIWNEDYDLIQDPNHRTRAVIKIVKDIGALSSDQLKDLMYNVQDTVEFNYKFYTQEFSNTILNHRLDTI